MDENNLDQIQEDQIEDLANDTTSLNMWQQETGS